MIGMPEVADEPSRGGRGVDDVPIEVEAVGGIVSHSED